jgi:hypothetical protein
MKSYSVFFREADTQVLSDQFIKSQLDVFQSDLMRASEMLATTGRIDGFRSGLLTNGDWSIWLEDKSGDRHNFLLFISRLEFGAEHEPKSVSKPATRKRLVVVDPGGARDSVGGSHPGYWSLEVFVRGFDPLIRDILDEVVSDIEAGKSSRYFSRNPDGTISIHIDRSDLGGGVHINCVLKFVSVEEE